MDMSSRILIIEWEVLIALDLENLILPLLNTDVEIFLSIHKNSRERDPDHFQLVICDTDEDPGLAEFWIGEASRLGTALVLCTVKDVPDEADSPWTLLRKPFSADSLEKAVRSALARSGQDPGRLLRP